MAANRLRLNPDKTEVLFWGDRRQAGVEDSQVLNGVLVPLKERVLSLGLTAVHGGAGQFCIQGSCLPAPYCTQAETLPARRLSCQSGACSSYLLLGLL